MIPKENSLELSVHSQYSTYKENAARREVVSSEILTLRGGKGVVVRWKKKPAEGEVKVGASAGSNPGGNANANNSNPDYTAHNHYPSNSNHYNGAAKSTQCQRGPKASRSIRSTYTGKSIESKKKVIRMLFVLIVGKGESGENLK